MPEGEDLETLIRIDEVQIAVLATCHLRIAQDHWRDPQILLHTALNDVLVMNLLQIGIGQPAIGPHEMKGELCGVGHVQLLDIADGCQLEENADPYRTTRGLIDWRVITSILGHVIDSCSTVLFIAPVTTVRDVITPLGQGDTEAIIAGELMLWVALEKYERAVINIQSMVMKH